MTARTATTGLDDWAHFWPRDGRLLGLHQIAIGRRIARGELPLAAQLNAIADVMACATDAERNELQTMSVAEEGGQ